MAVFTPTITGLTSLTTENINIDNNSITALNSSIEQVSYTSITTNQLAYSEQFDNGAWTKNNSSVTANSTTAPNGTTTADTLTESSSTGTQQIYETGGLSYVANTVSTWSIYLKNNTRRYAVVLCANGSTNWFYAVIDLQTGLQTASGNGAAGTLTNFSIVDAGSGWYRCELTGSTTGASNLYPKIILSNVATPTITSYGNYSRTGDGTSSIFIWGAQFESTSSATGYLPTTSASLSGITGVTRGTNGTTAATASSGGVVTLGSTSTTLAAAITATQIGIPLASLTGVAASGTASIGTSNMDLNLSSSGTGSVTINEIKTNSVTGEVIPGKIGGTNFTNSLLIGHSTTGTLNAAQHNTGVGVGALDALTQGDNNTAIGSNAGTLITSGTRNTMLGSGAGDSVNSAVNNTLIGSLAGAAIANSGHYNTLIGKSAGQALTTGDGNVIIGVVDADSDTGDRQLKIAGFDGTTTTAWISGDSSGNLTFPAQTTTDSLVAGSISVDNLILNSNAISAVNSSVEQINYSTLSSNEITYSQDGTQLNSSGNVTVANGAGTAPDGTNTAVSMTPTGSGTSSYVSHFAQLNPVVAGVSLPMTYSVYVKGTGFIQIYSNTFHIGNGVVNVDLSDGSITIPTSVGGNGYVKSFDVGNGWYRVEIGRSETPSLTYYQGAYYIASVDSASASRLAVSSNTDVKYWWGAQFEKTWQNGSTISASTGVTNAGPYVPTDGTRIALALAGVNRTASVADSVIRGSSGTTASSANADVVVNIGSTTTALLTSITTTSKVIPIDEVSGLPTSGTAVIGTSNVDLNLSASGTGNVKLANDEKLVFGDAGENIVGDGTNLTITSSGTTTIDSTSTINLDADDGNIYLKDAGTLFGYLARSGSNFYIKSQISDGDLILQGNDGGSTIIALTLDMSEAGAATFNDKIILGASKAIEFGDAAEKISGNGTDLKIESSGKIIIDADSSGTVQIADNNTQLIKFFQFSNFVAMESMVSNKDLHLRGNDNGSYIDALSLDMSEAGAATFNDKIILGANKAIEFGDAGEYIVGDGTNLNIVSSNALGIDVPNGITLDSGSGGTTLRAGGGTTYGTLTSSSGDFSINQTTSDKDIIFTGNDGGSTIEAMRIDMSEGGRVGIGTANPATSLQIHNSGTGGGDHAYLNFTTGDTGSAYSDGLTVGVAATAQGQIIFRESNFLNIGSKLHTSFLSGSSLTERVRINSNGIMSVLNGIALGVGTATTDSNVLDDYEEGTWTPNIDTSGGTLSGDTYSVYNRGWYTKVGNTVTLSFALNLSNKGSGGSGAMRLVGFPFASTQTNASVQACVSTFNSGRTEPMNLYGTWSGGYQTIRYDNATGGGELGYSEISNNFTVSGQITMLV